MSEGKAQVEKTIEVCKEAIERLRQLPEAKQGQIADGQKRLNDIAYALEGIQNKVFFKTKTALNFTMPTLGAAERLLEALEELGQSDGDVGVVLDELDSLESNVDTLKVTVANRDIIIT
jgi:hypothetical protein